MKKFLTPKNIAFALIVIGLVIALFQVDSCRNNEFKAQRKALDSTTLANQELIQTVNKKNEIISKQEVVITGDQNSLKKLTLDIFDLKKNEEKRIKQIDALIKIKSSTSISQVKIPYIDSSERRRFSDSLERACADIIAYYDSTYIRTPKKVIIDSTQNKDFQFMGTIKQKEFIIDSLSFPNEQAISVIETKGGLFRRDAKGKIHFYTPRKMEIMVKNSNKYVNVKGMNSIVYKPKIRGRWLERVIGFGAGVAAGILLVK